MFEGFFYQLPQLEAEKVYIFGISDSDQITDDDFSTLESLLSKEELLEVASIFALPARRTLLLAYALRRYVLCYYLGKQPHQLVFETQENDRIGLKGNRLFHFDLMKEGTAAFALSMNFPIGLCTEKHAMTSKPKALARIASLRALGNYHRGKVHRRRIVWNDKSTSTKHEKVEHTGVSSTWVGTVHWQIDELMGHKSSLGIAVISERMFELEVLLCLPERIIDSLPIEKSEMSQQKYRYLAHF